MHKTTLEKAQQAWGNTLPEWIKKLAMHIDASTSQRYVADKLGYSNGLLSNVINNKYAAPMDNVQQAVEVYLNKGVSRVGEFRSTNPILVRATRAHIRKTKGK